MQIKKYTLSPSDPKTELKALYSTFTVKRYSLSKCQSPGQFNPPGEISRVYVYPYNSLGPCLHFMVLFQFQLQLIEGTRRNASIC